MKKALVNTAAPPADASSPITAQTLHTVTLGNGIVVRFTSRRQALAFQAEASRWLSDAMMTANLLLIEAFSAYRMLWPVLPSTRKGDRIGDLVLDAHRMLDTVAADAYAPDAVHRRWKALNDSVGAIREMALAVRDIYRNRSEGVQRHQMEVLLRRANQLQADLKHFGSDVDTSHSFRPSPRATW